MEQYPRTCCGSLPRAAPAVDEFYSLLTNLLPTRYPTAFSVSSSTLHNHINNSSTPLDPPSADDKLRAISRNLDEDFLILLKAEDGDGYVLGAHIACFPAGFNVSAKLGWRIRDIHGPVPRYKEKLQPSMERFFDKMETGRFVRRCNWTVVTRPDLFCAFTQTHHHEGESEASSEEMREKEKAELNLDTCFQRTESQTLYRLPESGALVFGIKTYMYPVRELKEEGSGEEFADAIEGLQKGNVPEIYTYKRGMVWRDKVVDFLRDNERGQGDRVGENESCV